MALSMAKTAADEHGSRVSCLAEIFHDFPHINYTFSSVNSTFNPYSNVYLESLGILASLPGFWLILNLLAFLIFFLSRCCERDWKTKNLTCYKWTLGIFAMFCCAALGLSFYGNDEVHNGVGQFATSLRNINEIINSVKNETLLIEDTLKEKTEPELDRLEEIFQRPIGDRAEKEILQREVKAIRMEVRNGTHSLAEINKKIQRLDMKAANARINQVEEIRWPVTMAVISVFILFCVVLLIGVVKNSRSTLIAFTVLGLLAVILNWLLVSIYMSSCVALGDLCVDPDYFVRTEAGNLVDKAVVDYYIECPPEKDSPLKKAIQKGKDKVQNVELKLEIIDNGAKKLHYPDQTLQHVLSNLHENLNLTERVLQKIGSLLNCKDLHEQYDFAVTAVCTPLLNGLALMLVSAATAGLFFIFLIWIAAHTWMYIRKRVVCAESDYVQVDEQDPFLPPSAVLAPTSAAGSRRPRDPPVTGRPRHTPPHTPPFPGAYNGRIPRGADDHLPMHGRYTPPPSYEQLSAFLPSAPYKSE